MLYFCQNKVNFTSESDLIYLFFFVFYTIDLIGGPWKGQVWITSDIWFWIHAAVFVFYWTLFMARSGKETDVHHRIDVTHIVFLTVTIRTNINYLFLFGFIVMWQISHLLIQSISTTSTWCIFLCVYLLFPLIFAPFRLQNFRTLPSTAL